MSTINPTIFPSELKSAPNSTTAPPIQCQNCEYAPFFSFKTLKTILWYILIGFVFTAFLKYLGFNSSPFHNRNNDIPMSICHSRDSNNLCASWASYPGNWRSSADDDAITQSSTECVQSGGSAEFKTIMDDGGVLFVCVK
ncbi:hypothetical protein KCU91_g680, partial [Aureobasidium melanogenum]